MSAESTGVANADLLDRCRPIVEAGYAMFRGFDEHKLRVETQLGFKVVEYTLERLRGVIVARHRGDRRIEAAPDSCEPHRCVPQPSIVAW